MCVTSGVSGLIWASPYGFPILTFYLHLVCLPSVCSLYHFVYIVLSCLQKVAGGFGRIQNIASLSCFCPRGYSKFINTGCVSFLKCCKPVSYCLWLMRLWSNWSCKTLVMIFSAKCINTITFLRSKVAQLLKLTSIHTYFHRR